MDHYDRLRAMAGTAQYEMRRRPGTRREERVLVRQNESFLVNGEQLIHRVSHYDSGVLARHEEAEFICPRCGRTLDWKVLTSPYGDAEGAFTAIGECCEPITAAGWYEGVSDDGYRLITFRLFDLPYTLLHVPPHVHPEILDMGWAASRVLWLDAAAAANKLRIALEVFLHCVIEHPLSVAKRRELTGLNNVGRQIQYAKKHDLLAGDAMTLAEVHQTLEEVRDVGNSGSHGDVLWEEQVIDAGERLARVIEQQFREPPRKQWDEMWRSTREDDRKARERARKKEQDRINQT